MRLETRTPTTQRIGHNIKHLQLSLEADLLSSAAWSPVSLSKAGHKGLTKLSPRKAQPNVDCFSLFSYNDMSKFAPLTVSLWIAVHKRLHLMSKNHPPRWAENDVILPPISQLNSSKCNPASRSSDAHLPLFFDGDNPSDPRPQAHYWCVNVKYFFADLL